MGLCVRLGWKEGEEKKVKLGQEMKGNAGQVSFFLSFLQLQLFYGNEKLFFLAVWLLLLNGHFRCHPLLKRIVQALVPVDSQPPDQSFCCVVV